jgi:hypothetical protein
VYAKEMANHAVAYISIQVSLFGIIKIVATNTATVIQSKSKPVPPPFTIQPNTPFEKLVLKHIPNLSNIFYFPHQNGLYL